MENATPQQIREVKKITELCKGIAWIVFNTPNGIPSGHLYAQLLGKCTLRQYEIAIQVLTETGFIDNKNHLLTGTQTLLQAAMPS